MYCCNGSSKPEHSLSVFFRKRAPPETQRTLTPMSSCPTGDSQLCNRCEQIDLTAVLEAPRSINGQEVMLLGMMREEMTFSTCPLCRLFASVSPLANRNQLRNKFTLSHLRAFLGTAISGEWRTKERNVTAPGIVLGVCEGTEVKAFGNPQRRKCFARGVIGPITPLNLKVPAVQIRLVDQETVDYGRIRDWIEQCRNSHTISCQSQDTPRPLGMKFIDCQTRKLVQIEPSDNYYALSYVWGMPGPGNSVHQVSNSAQELPVSGVPRVIEDSISVVRELGGRFLWVDKYCINQNDATEKRIQIKSMDAIYEGATATIIAVAGSDSNCGLPGVNGRPRAKQPTAWVGGTLLASSLPHVSIVLANSSWATRGWTYQEAILSIRCLFFTDQQVYFVCRGMDCCESIELSPTPKLPVEEPIRLRADIFDVQLRTAGRQRIGLWEFFDHLHHYKNRQLSYDHDSLNAFRGIIAKFPYISIWGVPIALRKGAETSFLGEAECSIGFARGLWWDSPSDPWYDILGSNEKFVTFRRRIDFPSWSWAGWSGPIRPHVPYQLSHYLEDSWCNNVNQYTSSTRFWVDAGEQRQLSILQFLQEVRGNALFPETSPVLHVEANIFKVRIRAHLRRHNPIAYVCDCPPERECSYYRHDTVKYNVRFFEDPLQNERLCDRVFSQRWDAVELFRLSDDSKIPSLIIDWEGDVANVVGFVYLHELLLDEWKHHRRRVVFKLA